MRLFLVVDGKKIKDYVTREHHGNVSAFAKLVGLSHPHMYKIINHGSGAGGRAILAFWAFCEDNNIQFKDFLRREVEHDVV